MFAVPVLAVADLPPLFHLLAIMLVSVVVVSLLLLRLQQSLLAGYFLSGVAIANSGVLTRLGGADLNDNITRMSDFGVMLLMFTLGLEFSLSELKYLRKSAFGGGFLQMSLCGAAAGILCTLAWGLDLRCAILLGVVFALSSTAVSLKTFQDLNLSSSPGARFSLAVAIFQDLFIILFFLILPALLPTQEGAIPIHEQAVSLMLRGAVFVAVSAIAAKWIIPALLGAVTRSRNRELFTLSVVGCCVGLAFLGGLLELGLALGAFVAGLAVSESIYKHRILTDVLPLKDLFLTIFFISVGLMVDLKTALALWQPIACAVITLMALKFLISGAVARLLGLNLKQALLAGIGLSSAGEFSLVLLQKAGNIGLWGHELQQILLAAVAISMGLLPVLMRMSDPLFRVLKKFGFGREKLSAHTEGLLRDRTKHLENHAIICGFGPVGQSINNALLDAGLPTLVIDLNADTVRRLQKLGQPVLFADAADEETWSLAQLAAAKMVVFSFADAPVAVQAMHVVQKIRPDIPLLARTRFQSDVERLRLLGVTQVVNDEQEVGRTMVESALVIHGG